MMKHKIEYNSQRDNIDFGGKFPGWHQCFTTCAWMFMSFYVKDIVGSDDDRLAVYFDDVEEYVGTPGIGEKIKQKFNWIAGKTSYWWLVQQAGIQKWISLYGVKGKAKFFENKDFNKIYDYLLYGPVILGTKKLGGLKGGHIILAVGIDDNGKDIICHDPYGDANTNYKNKNGKYVIYKKDMLMKHVGKKATFIVYE